MFVGGVFDEKIEGNSAKRCIGRIPEERYREGLKRLSNYARICLSDASVFHTSIGVPPRITIMALATRASENIAEGLGEFRRRKPIPGLNTMNSKSHEVIYS